MVVKADITIDIDKQVGNLQNLTNIYNARVGDSNTPLTVLWQKNGIALNLKGLHAFIAGKVGDGAYNAETDKVDFPVGSPVVKYEDDGSGTLDDGQSGLTTLLIPKQMWAKTGLFFGYIGLKDENGSVFTSKDIFFKILGNVLDAGIEINYFIGDFDKALAKAEKELEDKSASFDQTTARALQDLHDKYLAEVQKTEDTLGDTQVSIDAMNSQVKASRAELTNINDHLSGVEQQIAINDIVTIPQHTEDLKNISNAIDERLANVKTAPVAVENAKVLQQSYPNGADGIFITADTGHKWLWLSGSWTDCGEYQAVGIGDELIQPIKQQQAVDQQDIATNYGLINQNSENIKENTVHLQEVQGAGKYTDVLLTDQDGNYITDQNDNKIVGSKWLVMTDKSLSQSDLPADANAVGTAIDKAIENTNIKPENYGIPILYLWGDNIPSLTKGKALEHQVTYNFPKYNVQGTLDKFKVQGQTSAFLAKKNYSLTFDQDFTVFQNYGKQHKYVIKANMTDFTQARNNVNAKIWTKLQSTRCQANDAIQDQKGNYLVDNKGNHIVGEADPQLSVGGTYGAIDGFPIAVYINDKYWGLYAFNMMQGNLKNKMPEKQGYGVLSAVWKSAGAFTSKTNLNDGLEVVFCGTKNTDWLKDAVNNLIDALIAHYDTRDAFDKAIADLLDLDSAIDYYIYSVLIGNVDGVYRNFVLDIFNGKKFYMSAYDLDETFGRSPQSYDWIKPDLVDNDDFWHYGLTFENFAKNNRLMYQLWKFHKDDILNRLKYLLDNEMSLSSVEQDYQDYVFPIPFALKVEEAKLWPQTQETSSMTLGQIWRWYNQRVNNVKTKYLENEADEISQLKAQINSIQQAVAAKAK